MKTIEQLTPREAGFDGAMGINLLPKSPMYPQGLIYKLGRGRKPLSSYSKVDFRNQLFWLMPCEENPRLLWCNESNEWFEVGFTPIEKP
jgi:hypothetical protein